MTQEQKIKELRKQFINRWCQGTGIYSERLNAEFDQLFDNWVSVEDDLPKDDDDVLIFIDDGYTEKNLSSLGNFVNSEWLINGRNEKTIAGMTVTHWQPLPQPPKGE